MTAIAVSSNGAWADVLGVSLPADLGQARVEQLNRFVLACRNWLDEADDVDQLGEARRVLEAIGKRLRDINADALDAELAVIRAVQRIGELTPKEPGRRMDLSEDSERLNDRRNERYPAWLLSDHPDIVSDILEQADPKKRLTVNGVAGRVRRIVKARQTGRQPEPLRPPGWTEEKPWGNVQHFDIWTFPTADGESSYFGKMPPQVVENLLWFYTDPTDVVVDPFGGGGTTMDVAIRMGRSAWTSDRAPSRDNIHEHDITTGWPGKAPVRANLILLDPPYWRQAKGRYSDSADDLGNMTLEHFYESWAKVVAICVPHLAEGGRLAYIISPTQLDDGSVVDHATDMLRACWDAGLKVERRIIVAYQTQQATGQQVTWARENRRLLKLYRDLVVLKA